jgi:tetratricopeptide (TPR) repeat protein
MATKTARKGAVRGRIVPRMADRLVAVAQTFDNKAGHYELIRIEGNTAYYAFTNHQGHRTEATMALMTWRRLQERVQSQPDPVSPPVLACLVVALIFAAAPPAEGQAPSTASAKAAASPEYLPTRSITLPGTPPPPSDPPAGHPEKPLPESQSRAVVPPTPVVAASLALAASSGNHDAEEHYKTAVLALKTEDLAVAAEEMSEAAKAAPDDALVLYGLAVIQARNQQPELALPNLEQALRFGLPGPESARAPDLLASIRYEIRKNEAEQKKVTPIKLWGSYESAVDDPIQEFEDRAGKTIFKLRTPLSREMFFWKVDSDSNVRGHWLEKYTLTEEVIYANSKRHDPKPKTTTEEHWWLVSILINPDGSLDGSRMETCTRETSFGCEQPDPLHGKVATFKGHVEPNGDLTITEGEAKQSLTFRKKSRVTSTPPVDVHIPVD